MAENLSPPNGNLSPLAERLSTVCPLGFALTMTRTTMSRVLDMFINRTNEIAYCGAVIHPLYARHLLAFLDDVEYRAESGNLAHLSLSAQLNLLRSLGRDTHATLRTVSRITAHLDMRTFVRTVTQVVVVQMGLWLRTLERQPQPQGQLERWQSIAQRDKMVEALVDWLVKLARLSDIEIEWALLPVPQLASANFGDLMNEIAIIEVESNDMRAITSGVNSLDGESQSTVQAMCNSDEFLAWQTGISKDHSLQVDVHHHLDDSYFAGPEDDDDDYHEPPVGPVLGPLREPSQVTCSILNSITLSVINPLIADGGSITHLPLFFFCGQHYAPNDSHRGPVPMLHSLLTQLMKHPAMSAAVYDIEMEQGVAIVAIEDVLHLFEAVLHWLPAGTAWTCVVDGLGACMGEGYDRMTREIWRAVEGLQKIAQEYENGVARLLVVAHAGAERLGTLHAKRCDDE